MSKTWFGHFAVSRYGWCAMVSKVVGSRESGPAPANEETGQWARAAVGVRRLAGGMYGTMSVDIVDTSSGYSSSSASKSDN